MRSRRAESKAVVIGKPLLQSPAFQRLRDISFLGILAPRYWERVQPPACLLLRSVGSKKAAGIGDSRADHSLAVARLCLSLVTKLGMPAVTHRYAVAWGLTHDIATWALSHTGEAAFSAITGTAVSKLRRMMILGSTQLPQELTVRRELAAMNVDARRLTSLFSREPPSASHRPNQTEEEHGMDALRSIVNCPLTPDTLDGIWRAGQELGLTVPEPGAVLESFGQSLFGPMVPSACSRPALSFWRRKSDIYTRLINRKEVVSWESRCSMVLREHFASSSLVASLRLRDDALVAVLAGTPIGNSPSVFRYKAPRSYRLSADHKRKRKLNGDTRVQQLDGVFQSESRGDENDDQ